MDDVQEVCFCFSSSSVLGALALDLKNYIMDDVQEVETYFPSFSVSTQIQNVTSLW